MRRVPKPLMLVLLALGTGAAAIAAIWMFVNRPTLPTDREVREMSAMTHGITAVLHSRLGMPLAWGLCAGAVAGGALLWLSIKRRWPLAIVAVAAIVSIGVTWAGRHLVVALEEPRYVSRSPYVHAATQLAIAGTVYFAALAVCAAAAFVLAPRPVPVLTSPAPPPSPG